MEEMHLMWIPRSMEREEEIDSMMMIFSQRSSVVGIHETEKEDGVNYCMRQVWGRSVRWGHWIANKVRERNGEKMSIGRPTPTTNRVWFKCKLMTTTKRLRSVSSRKMRIRRRKEKWWDSMNIWFIAREEELYKAENILNHDWKKLLMKLILVKRVKS